MKDKIFGVLQRVGRTFMLPIAILPVAGLLLGQGGSLTNETMLETYGLMDVMGTGTFLNAVFQVMSDAGNIVFANLPIIFAMGVAIHCVFAGAAYMLMHIFNVGVGMTFSGGMIDLFLFSFLIRKMDLKTPGRDDSEEVKLYRRSDVDAKKKGMANGGHTEYELSKTICQGLGGKKNISDVDCCATRLRCTVYKAELVNDNMLKGTGASGVVHKGNGVQIIYGPRVTVVKSNLEDYLETAPNEEYIGGSTETAEAEHVQETPERKVKESVIISSPISGTAADLATAPDEAFAGKMMGDGAVVTPTDSYAKAPEDGEVGFVFETGHAVGFVTDSGINLLIHVGIDTVNLKGEGFEVLVENGQKVKKGAPLLKLYLEYLKAHAPSIVSPVLCTELEENQQIRLLKEGTVQAGKVCIG